MIELIEVGLLLLVVSVAVWVPFVLMLKDERKG